MKLPKIVWQIIFAFILLIILFILWFFVFQNKAKAPTTNLNRAIASRTL